MAPSLDAGIPGAAPSGDTRPHLHGTGSVPSLGARLRSRGLGAVTAAVLALVGWLGAACGTDDGDDGGASRRPPPAEPTEAGGDSAGGVGLTSPAFAEGGDIPDGFTCDGANASPPLAWTALPDGTVEVAITVVDPDAPTPEPFVHWVAWGIDPESGRLPEETLPAGVVEGANGTGSPGWQGPCPPAGDGSHRYVFTLFALSAPVALTPGASLDELRAAVAPTTLAEAQLTGRYQRADTDANS